MLSLSEDALVERDRNEVFVIVKEFNIKPVYVSFICLARRMQGILSEECAMYGESDKTYAFVRTSSAFLRVG